jgi:putative acetyltransferase
VIEIRSESPADVRAIEAVTVAAFLDAPHTGHTEHLIVNALRAAGQLALSLVAVSEGEIAGHVAVSPVEVSDRTGGWYGLGPISVLPQRQRQGIGTRLMQEALRRLRERGAAGCVLVGEPQYYGRFGFRAEPGLTYPGIPPAYFQALSFGAAVPRGVISYSGAFNIDAGG